MKLIRSIAVALFVVTPLGAQEVVKIRGTAPSFPPAGKWVGSTRPLRIEEMRGKVVIVHFWHEGSKICKLNSVVLKEWVSRYDPAALTVIGIHGPDYVNNPELPAIEKQAKQWAKAFPTVIDETDLSLKDWKVDQVPTLFLIDKKGQLRYSLEGQIVFKRMRGDLLLQAKIDELLKEK